MTTYRTNDASRWGNGVGRDLTATEIDLNFYGHETRISTLETSQPQPDNISNIAVSGTSMTITLQSGRQFGPLPLPVLMFRWRGVWAPLTSYAQLDAFTVTGVGLFVVLEAHTSAGLFNGAATDILGNPLYQTLFGFSGQSVALAGLTDVALAGLADKQVLQYSLAAGKWVNAAPNAVTGIASLSDVLLSSLADQQILRYIAAAGKWENATLGSMATQNANAVAITGATQLTGLPTPVNATDAATKAYVDSVGAGGLPSIPDGNLLVNMTGGPHIPAGGSLTAFLDYIFGNPAPRGTMIFRGASGWVGLAPGINGQVLKTGGTNADLSWINSTSASFAGDTDVNITSPANNDIVRYVTVDGKWENQSLSALLDALFGNAQGTALYRGATGWAGLAPGVLGQVFTTQGASANPLWSRPGASCWLSNANISTTTALPACTYANGTAGVGATLTGNSNGVLANQDGTAPVAGWKILVKNQAAAAQNGLYDITQLGDASHPFILTRSTIWDGSAGDFINTGAVVTVAQGSLNAKSGWMVVCSIAGSTYAFGSDTNTWSFVFGSAVLTTATLTLAGDTDVNITSPADKDQLIYSSSAGKWLNQRARYIVSAAALSGILTASQLLLVHKFSKAVTFPANFGAYLGHTSEAGGTANTTASTVINIDKATAAAPNTFSNVGTITFAASGVSATFASSGGAAVNFAQGDVLRMIGPSSADATFANFYSTLVGFET